MIHAVCDFCGKDCDRVATLLTLTPFQNFARYHSDTKPYGVAEGTQSFVICWKCCEKHNLPNPHETRFKTIEKVRYENPLDSCAKEGLATEDLVGFK